MSIQQKRVELLSYGYIRENCKKPVPIALINLCKSFYDEYLYWIIKGDILKQFTNSEKGEEMAGPKVTINNIEFQIFLLPKGLKEWNDGLPVIGFYIQMDRLPDNIDKMEFYGQLCCENTKTKFKFTNKCSDGFAKGWSKDMLRFNDCLVFDELYFNVLIDIKTIIYKSNKNNYISMRKMRKYVNYTWYIDDKMAETFKNAWNKQFFYGPNFDHNNWCLMVIPNEIGEELYDKRYYDCILVKSLNIPNHIAAIAVDLTFNYEHDLTVYHVFTRDCPIAWIKVDKSSGKIQYDQISVSLLITNVMDENGKEIRENEWSKYGIINYVYCPFIDNC